MLADPVGRTVIIGALPPARGLVAVLTGGTSDLPVAREAGQATLERLLSSYPDTRISVLIRPRGGRCATDWLTALLPNLDVVIHGASTVSFDPPVDEAFRTNVAGVATLYTTLAAAGGSPHVVHVSTAYVADTR